ncbi:hypothetical protein [Methylobacterium sp. ARG-1]|uniref:hypothetical protein n=1 Tax=Methylobacterium sp. ARG-1 TaxID=1692501 RepID=UPI000681E2E6|nr:hypothetical protein [Methylobacterium sp. ARG-1]KNY21991.1 hypothetical protein AKJ13_14150 [Methylobacterium sp. ARG-1]
MVEDYARRLGIDTLFVNAALDAERFYVATGWTHRLTDASGQLGQLEAIVPMVKNIARRGS